MPFDTIWPQKLSEVTAGYDFSAVTIAFRFLQKGKMCHP